jgi:2-keto-4-pentenoate hydratase/2-oxohepta-3-ene-1,7-dioic acid hydratase in catechol pathway
MRLVTFEAIGRADGPARAGALIDGDTGVVDLQAAFTGRYGAPSPDLASVLAIAEGGPEALGRAAQAVAAAAGSHVVARGDVRLLAPIPRPPQMRDFLCFEKHLVQAFQQLRVMRASESADPAAAMAEMERDGTLAVPKAWYERPIYYHPNRLNVVGHDCDVVWPAYSARMDYELEFGAYIGRGGRDIGKARARDHIFGYTIFNDFSARDEQTKDMPGQLGPGKGKDFDGGNVMGPCLVTADELTDPYDLTMIVRVNGEERGRGHSSEMAWRFEDCIAHVSRSETLEPGEFFGSGTVGDGCGVEHMRFLEPGDVVELEVERIGVLRNRIVRRDDGAARAGGRTP